MTRPRQRAKSDSHHTESTREFPNSDPKPVQPEQPGASKPPARLDGLRVSDVAGLAEAGSLSPYSCPFCKGYHKGIRRYFCEVEIASHSESAWQGPHRETCACLLCIAATFRRLSATPVKPILSPIYEEAMDQLHEEAEQLANMGAIR